MKRNVPPYNPISPDRLARIQGHISTRTEMRQERERDSLFRTTLSSLKTPLSDSDRHAALQSVLMACIGEDVCVNCERGRLVRHPDDQWASVGGRLGLVVFAAGDIIGAPSWANKTLHLTTHII